MNYHILLAKTTLKDEKEILIYLLSFRKNQFHKCINLVKSPGK